MTSQTRATLKSYFNTGDQPTEAQFADLIDSAVNIADTNPGVGTDEYALVYDHDTAQFVLRAPFAGLLATGATVGATSQAQAFTTGIKLPNTTSAATGIIYKDTAPFFHNFNPPNTDGGNIFMGGAGNFTMAWDGANSYTAARNVGIGPSALTSLTTGYFNYGIGYKALNANTTGGGNVAIGANSLPLNIDGFDNVAIADDAMLFHAHGKWNVAVGHSALHSQTSADSNVAVGYGALFSNLTGAENVAIGTVAGNGSLGNRNVFLGYNAGGLETGSEKLYIANNNATTLIYGDFALRRVSIGNNSVLAYGLNVVGTSPDGGIRATTASASQFQLMLNNLTYGSTDAKGFGIIQRNTGTTGLWVNNVEAIDIDATGKVGIGDTAPAEALDVTGNINATGVYKVDDVQVLSNRVIDARCADVANSGDATTDGLIDALRDAMIAHGLIAAA